MTTILRLLALVFLLSSMAAPVAAGPVRQAEDASRDQRQTMQARRLLLQDPDLAGLNIGVIVQDRVAILWGPAPSPEIAFRAELCLRAMVELKEVRNELILNEFQEPIRKPPVRREAPSPVLPELLPPELPKDERAISAAPGVLTGKSISPADRANRSDAKSGNIPPDATAKPLASGNSGVQDLTTGIRVLLNSKNTYRYVQFAIQGGRVYVRSTEPNQTDILHEIARVIARLPNVEGVVVIDKANQGSPD